MHFHLISMFTYSNSLSLSLIHFYLTNLAQLLSFWALFSQKYHFSCLTVNLGFSNETLLLLELDEQHSLYVFSFLSLFLFLRRKSCHFFVSIFIRSDAFSHESFTLLSFCFASSFLNNIVQSLHSDRHDPLSQFTYIIYIY